MDPTPSASNNMAAPNNSKHSLSSAEVNAFQEIGVGFSDVGESALAVYCLELFPCTVGGWSRKSGGRFLTLIDRN